MIELVFLGTGAMKPTIDRFVSSIVLRYRGEVLMFDCGEGAQIRLAQSGFSPMKIDKIFITHFHGDHVLGIPGMLFTMSQNDRKKPLEIYGPRGTEKLIDGLLSLPFGKINFEVRVTEVSPGQELDFGYKIKVFKVKHGWNSVGYVFEEPDRLNVDRQKMREYGLRPSPKFKLLKQGKEIEIKGIKLKPEEWLVKVPGGSIAYTGDTSYYEKIADEVRGVDVLIHEATYLHEDREKAEGEHSSAREAAKIARMAGVKYLFLTHISSRYRDASLLLEEASRIFPHTYLAEDLEYLLLKKGLISIGRVIKWKSTT